MSKFSIDNADRPLDGMLARLNALRFQERVCVFIDNSNLFHAIRNHSGGKRLDYIKLIDYIADGRSLDVRFYYSESDDNRFVDLEKKAGRDKFYRFLADHLKFQMIRLPLRERSGYNQPVLSLVNHLRSQKVSDEDILKIAGQKIQWLQQIEGEKVAEEKGLDCEIVYDMSRLAIVGKYKNFILIAGDEDYARTVSKIKAHYGIITEVVFFGSGYSATNLLREASAFIDLDTIPEIFV